MLGPNGRCNLLCYSTQLIGNFVVLSLAMFLLAMNSCAISGAKGLHEKERLAKVNLRKGMSIDDAIATMEPFGFECKLLKNATLSYHAKPDDITPTALRGVDYLYCVAKDRKGLVTSILAVQLLIVDDKVDSIYYEWLFDGL